MCIMLRDEYNGILPDTVEELTKLPGVGRKTANLIVGDVYKKPAVVADTHLIRITNLLGLVETKDPKRLSLSLKKFFHLKKVMTSVTDVFFMVVQYVLQEDLSVTSVP